MGSGGEVEVDENELPLIKHFWPELPVGCFWWGPAVVGFALTMRELQGTGDGSTCVRVGLGSRDIESVNV